MARKGDRLRVWLGETEIAVLTSKDRLGRLTCRYTEDALTEWSLNAPLLSCSLPLSDRPVDATAFFRGLLPEGDALRILAERANVTTSDVFSLLDHYGRDVAGAVVVSREDPGERKTGMQVLSESELEDAVDSLAENPLGAIDESELSLAGLQDKILLVKTRQGWARPLGGTPSTHILKVDDLRFPGLVRAEKECLDLARSIGLTTVDAEIINVGDRDCLVVSRFDRLGQGADLKRIHQEDLCQAVGLDPIQQNGRIKYERYGGPGFKDMASVLDRYSAEPSAQMEKLVQIITFTVAIGNADAHGKNLAFLHPSPEAITLAPLYDTVPTRLWPKLRAEAAMSVGGQPDIENITINAIVREAQRWPLNEDKAIAAAEKTADALLDLTSSRSTSVDSYVHDRATKLLEHKT